MSADGTEAEAVWPSPQRGGIGNLRPPSTTDEAREWGRRGGIASGEARRRRASLRDELASILTAEGGVVAKSIAVAICGEAKRGNVGAFKAIAQVLGELKEVVGVEAEALPPPIVIPIHDPAFVEAERERQRREFAEIAEAAVIELKAGTGPTEAGSGETRSAAAQPSGAGTGNWATVAPSAGRSGADGAGTGIRPAGSAPDAADGETPVPDADAPVGRFCADGAVDWEPPSHRVPRSPSEAARMRRERERAAERTADGTRGTFRALPATFPKR